MKRRDFLKWAGLSAAAALFWASPWPEPKSGRPRPPRRASATACPPSEARHLILMAAGDIMMHLPVSQSALQPDGSYDFRPHFQYVRPFFRNADLVIGNLETPLAGGRPSGYPTFNGPDELLDALKWAGFSALNLANNHSLDQGWKGLSRTAELSAERGFMYMGAYLSAEDRRRARIFSAAGVRVGLLGYTYGVNGPWKYPDQESWRLDFVNEELMRADLRALRAAGADFSVVNVHFGDEYQRLPNKRQLALAETLFEAGADLIIGHHPHVVQPGLVSRGPDGARAAVFSLGNFISNQKDRHTDQGLMITVNLHLDFQGRKSLGPITLHQTRCLRRLVDGRPTYRVLPVFEAVQNPAAYGLTEAEMDFLARDQSDLARRLIDY
ncbi:MAG: CapA family protein [Candidatus Adiutrix sp.]|jgi:poly-gamma-glutamate synthesis protein (capsule biosynthesis protein)|nr:CapA family protein [Candidatus Adiutrix sp.]